MPAYAMPKRPTAFANAPAKGKKRPRVEDKKHLGFIRTLPCCITGMRPVEAAHVRYADPRFGKRETGKGEKSDDCWALPLSPALHREQHDMDEREFWRRHGIDPVPLALALSHATGDDEQAELILREHRHPARLFDPSQHTEDQE